jgi:hypothetical protein
MEVISRSPPRIQLDWPAFNPWRVQELSHALSGHPLLQLDRLAELGKRLEGSTQVYSFDNSTQAGDNLSAAARKHPNRNTPAGTIEAIESAHAWMVLRHVQTDPEYRQLIDDVLDSIQPEVERTDPGMHYRAGWIVVSSPHTVTPFHMDRNHGMLLQILGSKLVYTWEPDDTVVVDEVAREHFHYRRSLALVHWKEEFRARAHYFQVHPGSGVYLPMSAPHMVETSNEPSITFTLSYNTHSSRRDALVHATHALLRRTGVPLAPVGEHPVLDSLAKASAESLLRMGGEKFLSVPHADGRRQRYAQPSDY